MTRPLLLLLAVALAGCDPAWQISGAVTTADGKPLAGARVAASCVPRVTESDESGRFTMGSIGVLRRDCTVEVARAGYRPAQLRVRDICRDTSWLLGGDCLVAEAKVALTPTAAR